MIRCRALLSVAILGMAAGSSAAQDTVRIFDLQKTSVNLEDAKALGILLAEYAQGQAADSAEYNSVGPYKKIIRVAYQLAPEDTGVAAAHARIRGGQPPEAPPRKLGRDKVMPVLVGLMANARAGQSKEDQNLITYLAAVGVLIEPENEACLKETLKQGNMDALWEQALAVYNRAVADGSVNVIKGLVVTTSGPAQVGAVSRILLTFRGGQKAAVGLEARMIRETAMQINTSADEAIRYWSRYRKSAASVTGMLEISFEDKFTPKDGPSAGAAYAVLLRSFTDPFPIDPDFAMTGDVSVEGRVLRVGGVFAKIRGAVSGGVSRVGIPAESEMDLADSLVMNGGTMMAEIEVIGMETVDDAIAVARLDRDEKSKKASADFAALKLLVDKKLKGATDPLLTESILKLTTSILDANPRHYSAKVIDLWNRNRLPKTLTLAGSLDLAHEVLVGYLNVIRRGDRPRFADIEYDAKTTNIIPAVDRLKSILPKLHIDAKKPGDKLEQCLTSIQQYIYLRADLDKKKKKVDDLQKVVNDLNTKLDRARADRKPQEEINAILKRRDQAQAEYKEALDSYNKDADARKQFLLKAVDHYNDFVMQVRTLVQDQRLLEKLLNNK